MTESIDWSPYCAMLSLDEVSSSVDESREPRGRVSSRPRVEEAPEPCVEMSDHLDIQHGETTLEDIKNERETGPRPTIPDKQIFLYMDIFKYARGEKNNELIDSAHADRQPYR